MAVTKRTEARFRDRAAELGCTVVGNYVTAQHPIEVRCSSGHVSHPQPHNVLQGQGICLACTWATQDVVYVVFNDDLDQVKLGITSGDPRPRLWAHAADGFQTVLYVRRGLPVGVAHDAEQTMLRDLRSRGVQPVQGREYFAGSHTAAIMGLLDNYLTAKGI